MSPPHNLYYSIQMLLSPQRNVFFNNFHVLRVAKTDPHNTMAKSHQRRTGKNAREECDCLTRYLLKFSAQVIAAVDSTQKTNLAPFVKSGMHFSILHQTKPLQAQSHFPLSQLQMSPLACLQ